MNNGRRAACLILLLLLPGLALGETTIVTLTCTGDVMIGNKDSIRDKDYSFQHYIEEYGYAYPFEKLLSLTAADDITLVNLECVLNDGEPYNAGKYYIRGPEAYAQILVEGSVEVANLANNHTGAFFEPGYRTTQAALDAVGIPYCGTCQYDNDTCYVDVKGVRIGFVGVYPKYRAEHPEETEKAVKRLRKQGCDVIVASVHCGVEYSDAHTDIQTRYGRIMRSLGVELVIGNHPHVPHGVEVTNGVTFVYSLGNCVFGGNTGVDERLQSAQSLIAQYDLYFEDGKYIGHQMTLWPILITGEAPVNNYQPILAQGDDAQAIMRKVQRDTTFKLNPYVDGEGAVQDFVPWNR